ncbi:MAG: imidazole glycerol phosphate synthase subunit HisH, partial [Candidatus Omnitrophota bacterium]|nr:imidazole glycerol phosphate synthase subunit HisH [Candidatus Omnitrophota bacterium]
MIAIIDYGMGNIHSIQKALELYGARTVVTNNASDIKECKKAVLPGVGAFDDAMRQLKKQGLITAINAHISDKKPFLGICLGMQLLFEKSQEGQHSNGLGILRGEVKRFKKKKGIKIPHMGW